MEHLLTVDELSGLMRCPKSTIYKMTCAKKIPFLKIYGLLRFKQEDIDKWMGEMSINPIAS